MYKAVRVVGIALVLAVVLALPALSAEAPEAAAPRDGLRAGLLGIAAALSVAFGALGTAWAQSRIGAAAAGAMAERPEIGGLMLVFLALPETMIILGFLVAFFLIGRI
ncbi:ATP synthase subunit c [bacterium HR32]|jgi:V/A-type H+-transporting ATPase subunit K|nr:ATP synthase subunit c [bacterium HR32]